MYTLKICAFIIYKPTHTYKHIYNS